MRLYQFANDGSSLIPWHCTPLGGAIPAALASFMGKLLVGCGKSLRLMECGRQRLLRKCEFQGLPNLVTSIFTQGYRVYVGDSHESFHFMRYRKHDNSFYIFADDFSPRCVSSGSASFLSFPVQHCSVSEALSVIVVCTMARAVMWLYRYLSCALHLDYDTMVGADKFGNLCVVRIPQDMSRIVEDDPTGGKSAAINGKLNSAPHKLEAIVNFHAGDLIMSLQLCSLQQGGQEV